jgi:signal transduction histidine kinase
MLSGDVYRTTITNRKKDGTLYDEDQTATPVRDATGTITHFVSTGRDITARKRTEQAVRRLNHLLEQETTRIANLLHDEAGQFLTSAHILIADVARDLPPAQRERLQSVRRNLDQVEEQLRTVSHDLHPRILQDLGLVETIRRRATAFSRRTGVATTVSAPDDFCCSPAVATILYRLVQEGLNNVARHAKAGSVTITLGVDGPSLSCAISDDGAGFDTETVLRNTLTPSLGLRGMRDRVEALGGTLSIVSAPGNGTEVRAVISEEATDVSPDTAGR